MPVAITSSEKAWKPFQPQDDAQTGQHTRKRLQVVPEQPVPDGSQRGHRGAFEPLQQLALVVLLHPGTGPDDVARQVGMAVEKAEGPQHARPPARILFAQRRQQRPQDAQVGHAPVVDQRLVEK
jgi:hypothetical protein